VQLGKDSWGLAAILVFSQLAVMPAVMALLASFLGFETKFPVYGGIAVAVATGTWLRIAHMRRFWPFAVPDQM